MGSYLDKLARGEQDMFLLGWSSSPDCDSALYALFHSKHHGSGGNRTYYTNPRIDELLDLAEQVQIKRKEINIMEKFKILFKKNYLCLSL